MRTVALRKKVAFYGFMLLSGVFLTVVAGGVWILVMPGRSQRGPLPSLTAAEAEMEAFLRKDVTTLAGDIGERNTLRYRSLQRAEGYIADRFEKLGFQVREQPYLADGKRVANIVAELKGTRRPGEIVVIGAHYDSTAGSPGADDNASGVAALLELARLLRDAKPARTVRFAAFTNEELPFFQTGRMGSGVYAAEAGKRGENIVGMLSLESIGYYSDAPGGQRYPFPFGLFYPDTGNFIGFVSNFSSSSLLRHTIGIFRKTTRFPSEGVSAPESIAGIGWSDHWSFWREGYQALMITDTALFRNPHYHEPTDTPEKLDYGRMARVVAGLGRVVEELAQ